MPAISPRIVLFDSRAEDSDAWPGGVESQGTRVQVCRAARDAVRALLEDDREAALVVRCAPDERDSEREALLLMQVARMRVPPASIIVLTADPEGMRAVLSAQGVTAEVLRSPATLADLVVRLGGP